jgi:integrase/DNA-directed RNA polymerase subunit RPC12/RpoP
MEEAPVKPAFQIEAQNRPRCPECGSERLYKDGLRYLSNEQTVQRYLCRDCGFRFSWPRVERQNLHRGKNLKSQHAITYDECSSRALALLEQSVEGAMSNVEEKNGSGLAGATETKQADIKGKIIEYAWWMQKQGYSPATVESRIKKLTRLSRLGADLLNPENVKETIAKQPWKISTKANVAAIYGCFAKLHGLTWEPPIYKPNYEMPFIPTEAEIDQLIAACGKKLSALLQLIKETGVRIGEACRIRWIDLDLEQKIIRVQAEKNSKPRIFRISDKLISMLNMLPKKNERIFPNIPQSLENRFRTARKRIALKLNNPRLMEIHFHTIRHWRATMLYHQTKDILHVKEFLGHRSLDSTLTYINIERALFNSGDNSEFHVKTAQKPEEIKALLEVGFEYVCEKDGLLFFRKRK